MKVEGDRRLHVLCKGEDRGPTVIIEAGAAASSPLYWRAQDEVAKVAHVCVYDRAGLGWSDPASGPRTLAQRADDLHALLRKGRIRGPFILAGHSMGGLLVRVYAKRYPRDVIGLVLVEPSEEVFNGSPENLARTRANVTQMSGAVKAAEAGVEMTMLKLPKAPPEQVVGLTPEALRAGQDDLATMARLPEQIAALGGLGTLEDLPLVVISRGKPDRGMSEAMNEGWLAAHRRLAALSSRATHITASNSGHLVNLDEPARFAEAVQVILAASGSKPSR